MNSDKRAWGLAIGAGGVALIAQGLVELLVFLFKQNGWVSWIALLILGVVLVVAAIRYVPELKNW